MENFAHFVKEKLKGIDNNNIVLTDYARRRAAWRQINLAEVYNDLLNPVLLVWAERQEVEGEERFNCYFVRNRSAYRCILAFENGKVKIINLIKLLKWQKGLVKAREK